MGVKKSKKATFVSRDGFTLVELMIALVVSGFIMAALYSAYVVQQKHATAQEQVAEMQQNLRAGINYLINDVRLAGFDPTGDSKAGIVLADNDAMIFTADLNGDGNTNKDNDDTNENVGYDIYLSPSTGLWTLGRSVSSKSVALLSRQPLADNIERIEFHYTLQDGTKTTSTIAQMDEIRSVTLSVLARAGLPDESFSNNITYTTDSGQIWGPYPDKYRRRLLITSVQLRNMGLAHE